MKLDLNKSMNDWIKILNDNLKWGIAFCIRITFIILTFLLVVYILKWAEITKDFKFFLTEVGIVEVKSEKPELISKPSTPIYKNDLKDIDSIKNLINNKLKKSQKDEK